MESPLGKESHKANQWKLKELLVILKKISHFDQG
jgi:hypothetical protein